MTQIIITGATGLLGKYLVERLLDDGFSVLAISRSMDNLRNTFCDYASTPHLEFVECDIRSLDSSTIRKFCKASALINGARLTDNLELDENGQVTTSTLISEFELSVCAPNDLVNKLQGFGNLKRVINI